MQPPFPTAPELLDDLPRSVLRHSKEYSPERQSRNWNKPVLHLYGKTGLQVVVQVKTPQGRPTAYWPKPELLEETFWFMGSGIKEAVGFMWSGKLVTEPKAGVLPAVADEHWWKTVRAVPSQYVQTDGGTERFLFYEALAVQAPVVTGSVAADKLVIKNAHTAASGQVVIIVNDGEKRHFKVVPAVPAGGQVEIGKAEFDQADGEAEKILAACRAQWESFGVTAAEAHAIVDTWKPDLLKRVGFLVVARLPTELYDKIFPLTIAPKPDELVRAGAIFDALPGDDGRLDWLPALKAQMRSWVKDLTNEDFDVRKQTAARFLRHGDLVRPFLQELAKSDDAEIRNSAAGLLAQLKPATLELPWNR